MVTLFTSSESNDDDRVSFEGCQVSNVGAQQTGAGSQLYCSWFLHYLPLPSLIPLLPFPPPHSPLPFPSYPPHSPLPLSSHAPPSPLTHPSLSPHMPLPSPKDLSPLNVTLIHLEDWSAAAMPKSGAVLSLLERARAGQKEGSTSPTVVACK